MLDRLIIDSNTVVVSNEETLAGANAGACLAARSFYQEMRVGISLHAPVRASSVNDAE